MGRGRETVKVRADGGGRVGRLARTVAGRCRPKGSRFGGPRQGLGSVVDVVEGVFYRGSKQPGESRYLDNLTGRAVGGVSIGAPVTFNALLGID